MKRIPTKVGQGVAERYGYDQVITVARKIGEQGGEHITTYGVDVEHCAVAAGTGRYFKPGLMKWPEGEEIKKPVAAGYYWAKWRIAAAIRPESRRAAQFRELPLRRRRWRIVMPKGLIQSFGKSLANRI